jgi:hypothetical protein
MNEIYSILDCWFKKNLMSLNLTKTNYIDFIVNNQVSKRIGNLDSNISRTMYTKFLGLNIQYDLAWNNHIDEIIKKLNITSYMIRNINSLHEHLEKYLPRLLSFCYDIWYYILGELNTGE